MTEAKELSPEAKAALSGHAAYTPVTIAAKTAAHTETIDVNSREAELWSETMRLKSDNENLRGALAALYADCADYIRLNNLYRSDGKSAIWNQAMANAAKALGVQATP